MSATTFNPAFPDALRQLLNNADKDKPAPRLPPSRSVPPSTEHAKYCRNAKAPETTPDAEPLPAFLRKPLPEENASRVDMKSFETDLLGQPPTQDEALKQLTVIPADIQPQSAVEKMLASPTAPAPATQPSKPAQQYIKGDDDADEYTYSSGIDKTTWLIIGALIALVVGGVLLWFFATGMVEKEKQRRMANRTAITRPVQADVTGFIRQMGELPARIVPVLVGVPAAIAAARGPEPTLTIAGVPVKAGTRYTVQPLLRPARAGTVVNRTFRPVRAETTRPARVATPAATVPGQLKLSDNPRHKAWDMVVIRRDRAHDARTSGQQPVAMQQPAQPTGNCGWGQTCLMRATN